MIRAILTDIEGTTSSLHFVHQVLFPYSARALPEFLTQHAAEPRVAPALAMVAKEAGSTELSVLTATLLDWLAQDLKHPALKTLQGLIWERGYRELAFKAHLYPEVAARLKQWQEAGLLLYVYSSGSVTAQKLFFGHSEAGDLLTRFSGYFDTAVGAKRVADSYRTIARSIGVIPGEILFLSDIVEELDAAHAVGMATRHLVREGELPSNPRHHAVRSFDDILVNHAPAG